ncbi:MAG: glycosyltransferase family 39 protein [Alphaproteobacteria bacterium]|nr:glycosyltransferase family 39 protein [Alphaproteobacteria bacterium]
MTKSSDWRPESDWAAGRAAPRLGPATWAVAALSLIGLALRLYHLGHLSLWHAEGLTFLYVTMPLEVLWTTPMGSHPPVYYTIIKALGAFGQTETTLRLMSAVAGAATIPVVYAIGRIFGGRGYGVAAAAALAVSGIHIEYSQEARSYAFAIFFLSLACLFSLRFVTRRQQGVAGPALRRDLYFYGVFAALAVVLNLATIYYFVGLAAVVVLYCLVADPAFPRWRAMEMPWSYIVASVLVVVFVAGLLAWIAPAARAFQWLNQYSVWSAMGIMTDIVGARHMDVLRTVSRLLMSVLCIVGAFILLRRKRYGPLGFVILFVAVVPALVWLSGFIKPIFMHRTVLPSVIGVALSIGALTLVRQRAVAGLLLAAFFLPALLNLHDYFTTFEKQDWRAAAAFTKTHRGDRTATVVCTSDNYWPLQFYGDRQLGAVFALDPRAGDLLFELDGPTLRAIKAKKIQVPALASPLDQQRRHAARWPDIKDWASLFNAFDEIWVIDGHCFGRRAQQAVARLRARLEGAGFTRAAHREFFENSATRYTRKPAAR